MLPLVRPGRNVRLLLSDEQKRATRDPDGLLLRRVLRALLQARHEAIDPRWRGTSFPLTAFAFQAVARRLGIHPCPGIKHSRALIRRGKKCGLLQDAGSYKAGWPIRRVPTYWLGARIVGLGRGRRTNSLRQTPFQPTRGRSQAVKRRKALNCWGHVLFGLPNGRPPPELSERQVKKMKSEDTRWAARGRSDA